MDEFFKTKFNTRENPKSPENISATPIIETSSRLTPDAASQIKQTESRIKTEHTSLNTVRKELDLEETNTSVALEDLRDKRTKIENRTEGITQIDSYKNRLTEAGYPNIADQFYKLLEPGDKPGKDNYHLTPEREGKLKKFIPKLLAGEHVARVVEERTGDKTDEDILKILFRNEERGVIDSERNFDFLINNINARKKEVEKNSEEVVKRVEENPIASEDELMIGIYKENLESQVRDAVVALRHKGYSSFESGFDDEVDGSQYMGFNKDSTKGHLDVSPALNAELKQYGVTLSIDTDKPDRDVLRLIPTIPDDSKPMDITIWKEIWDKVASNLPTIGQAPANKRGSLAEEFAERQQKIKNGENVYLGYGVAFLDGRAQEMNIGEFMAKTHSNS